MENELDTLKNQLKILNFMSKKWCFEEEQKIIKEKIKDASNSYAFLKDCLFGDFKDEFLLKLKIDGARERTIQNYKYRMNNYFDKFFKRDTKVKDVFKERKVEKFKEWILGFDYKTNYKNLILMNFTKMVNFACDRKVIDCDLERTLLKSLKRFKNFDKKEEIHTYTPPSDAKKVWESAENETINDVIELFYYSGCRISEFQAIQKKDITFYEKKGVFIAKVNISKQLFTQKRGIVPYLKNISSNRYIYYLNDVAHVLEKYIKENKFDNEDLISPLSKNTFRRVLNKAFKKSRCSS